MREIDFYKGAVRDKTTPNRFQHSLRVAEQAVKLAAVFGIDQSKAFLAGLLHDYARDLSAVELLQKAGKYGLIEIELERAAPILLHGPVGSKLLEDELNFQDTDILRAISRHTVGDPDMTLLDRILYVADMTEAGRSYPGVEELRRIAEQDLDKALLKGFDITISYVLKKGWPIHPKTVEARNRLLLNNKSRFLNGAVDNPHLCRGNLPEGEIKPEVKKEDKFKF